MTPRGHGRSNRRIRCLFPSQHRVLTIAADAGRTPWPHRRDTQAGSGAADDGSSPKAADGAGRGSLWGGRDGGVQGLLHCDLSSPEGLAFDNQVRLL